MRIFSILCALCLSTLFGTAQNRNKIIVKFKSEISYQVDYEAKKFLQPQLASRALLQNTEEIHSMADQRLPVNVKLRSIDLIRNIHFVTLPATADIDAEINTLLSTGLFEYVERDNIGSGAGVAATVPNDPSFTSQWSLVNLGSFSGTAEFDADIDMDEGWDITTGDANTIVCVLDAGFKMDHPELAGRIWQNPGEIAANGIDDDANGYVDDTQGWDWANIDNNPTDDHGHGTNVASIITAKGNNANGMAGVNWNCKLMVGKILDAANSGFYSWWEAGIYYAVNKGAKVINMSVGGSGFSASMQDACDFALANNVFIVACMHNQNTSTPYYPAALASVIAVGSTSDNDRRTVPFPWSPTSGSNYGSHNDVIAPGNLILGALNTNNTAYNYWAGTSQATPQVAGVISLMLALKPDITFTQVMNILATTSEDQVGNPVEDVAGWDQYYGHGRLNAFAALNAVLAIVPLRFQNIHAQRKTSYNEISWATSSEEGIVKYFVEYSPARINWQSIGEQSAAGVANGEGNYVFTHSINSTEDAFYRIKAVNTNGSYYYSKIVRIDKSILGDLFTINPLSANQTSITVATSAQQNVNAFFSLFTVDGKLISRTNKVIPEGVQQSTLNVNLQPGYYRLVVVGNGKAVTKPIIVR